MGPWNRGSVNEQPGDALSRECSTLQWRPVAPPTIEHRKGRLLVLALRRREPRRSCECRLIVGAIRRREVALACDGKLDAERLVRASGDCLVVFVLSELAHG